MILYLFSELAFKASSNESVRTMNINEDPEKNYYRSQNEGNFFGLVKLLSSENSLLAGHLKKCKDNLLEKTRRITFLSDHFIKKALLVIRRHLIDKIVTEIKDNGNVFGVELDTTQDVSSKHQCSVVVRYINSELQIFERTVSVVENICSTGLGLYNLLKKSLEEIGLKICNIKAFSFDGAANMQSEGKGVKYYIKQNSPSSISTWCFSHRLNLVVKDALSFKKVKYVLGVVQNTGTFIKHSYKRMEIWNKTIQTLLINSKTKLKIFNETRWSAKFEAVHQIVKSKENLFAVIKTYLQICQMESLDNKALANACEILNFHVDYENILILFVLNEIFSPLMCVTKQLQTSSLSLIEAIKLIGNAYVQIENKRNNYEEIIENADQFIQGLNQLLIEDAYIKSLYF